jgi:ribosomal protein S27AE
MKISLDSRQCPKCTEQIFRDFHTGPGKWFWCEKCGDFTITPQRPEDFINRKEKS